MIVRKGDSVTILVDVEALYEAPKTIIRVTDGRRVAAQPRRLSFAIYRG